MSREEKRVYIVSCIGMAIAVVVSVILMTNPAHAESAKKGSYADDTVVGEELCPEDPIVAKTGQIREDTASLMPCEDPKAFQEWLETYEQETSEEEAEKPNINTDRCEDVQTGIPTELPTEVETTVEVPSEPVEETVAVYSVNGETLNPDIQEYLYQRLADYNIEWFMPYSILICYQESRFDCTAVNPHNGIDCGLFQFRAPYYEGQDIFNPYEQIDIFARQMANRANNGKTVSEMISAHNVSDYGVYNQTYVNQVMAHAKNLREVK